MMTVGTHESAGKAGRMAELYRRHAPDVARLAYLLTGDRPLAEDIVHEAFVRMLGRFADLRSPESFHWYLRRTVVNLVHSHFRHLKVERNFLAREAGAPRAPSDRNDLEGREDMWRTLLRLPERQRVAIVLRFYEDLTEAQTADVMGCAVGTVKSLVWRGLERLRIELAPER